VKKTSNISATFRLLRWKAPQRVSGPVRTAHARIPVPLRTSTKLSAYRHKRSIDFIRRRGGKPKLCFLDVHEENRNGLSKGKLGFAGRLGFPKAKLAFKSLDTKIENCLRIRLNKAGALGRNTAWAEVQILQDCRRITGKRAGIRSRILVLAKSAFGDSGPTPRFSLISNSGRIPPRPRA